MARNDLKNSNFLLENMRVIAHVIHDSRDQQTLEAISLADFFTELDEKLCEGSDFPRDWIPL